MTGRPTDFTQDLADKICVELASGKSLRKICDGDDTPHIATVLLWVSKGSRGDERYKDFYEQYTHAREAQAELFADELIDIADTGNTGAEPLAPGVPIANLLNDVQRAKLRVDTRKWVMSKLLPKRYGDKLQHTDPDGKPLSFTIKVGDD